jgi:hypothetical protein
MTKRAKKLRTVRKEILLRTGKFGITFLSGGGQPNLVETGAVNNHKNPWLSRAARAARANLLLRQKEIFRVARELTWHSSRPDLRAEASEYYQTRTGQFS